MIPTVYESAIPAGTKIASHASNAYFADAWTVSAGESDLSALGQFIKAVRATPRWVDACMKMRNLIVQLVGLKNLGGMAELAPNKPESDYKIGERLGIFTLLDVTPDEVLVGDNDKHLNVTLSVSRDRRANGDTLVTVTTIVHVHNLLGKIYMLPVAPMHKLIAPAVAKAIARAK